MLSWTINQPVEFWNQQCFFQLKFRFSTEATKLFQNLQVELNFTKVNVKSTGRFHQFFVAFLEKLNCTYISWNHMSTYFNHVLDPLCVYAWKPFCNAKEIVWKQRFSNMAWKGRRPAQVTESLGEVAWLIKLNVPFIESLLLHESLHLLFSGHDI